MLSNQSLVGELKMKLDLIIGAVIFAVLAALGFYIWGLNSRIDMLERNKAALTEQLQKVTLERNEKQRQVLELTLAASAAADRQAQSLDAIKKLQVQLARKRADVQAAPIPTQCPDALNWIADELRGSE